MCCPQGEEVVCNREQVEVGQYAHVMLPSATTVARRQKPVSFFPQIAIQKMVQINKKPRTDND
jgi:chemotaxis receptor (MCP) glutamine deamidase CheD